MKRNHVVGFKTAAGTIGVSHYCYAYEIKMWESMGYIVWIG